MLTLASAHKSLTRATNIAQVEQMRGKFMAPVKSAVSALLKPAMSEHPAAVESHLTSIKPKLQQLVTQHYMDIGKIFADHATIGLGGADVTKNKSYQAGVSAFIASYSDQWVPPYVDQINDSFVTHTKTLVDDNTTDPAADLAGDLADMFEYGTLLIAGMIVILASGLGGLAGADSYSDTTSSDVVKVWQAIDDKATRPSHSEADGQQQPIDQPFTVGDSQLMFPLDSSLGADAGEIINCRCVQGFDSSSS